MKRSFSWAGTVGRRHFSGYPEKKPILKELQDAKVKIFSEHFARRIEQSKNQIVVFGFDWDGTLAKTRVALKEALWKTLLEFKAFETLAGFDTKSPKENMELAKVLFHHEASAERAISAGIPKDVFSSFVGEERWEAAYERYQEIYQSGHKDFVKFKSGAENTLNRLVGLRAQGFNIKIALISHKELPFLLEEAKFLLENAEKSSNIYGKKSTEVFDYIQGTGSVDENKQPIGGKPTVQPFLNAVKFMGVKSTPEKVPFIYFGDSKGDAVFVDNIVAAGYEAEFYGKNRRIHGDDPHKGRNNAYVFDTYDKAFERAVEMVTAKEKSVLARS